MQDDFFDDLDLEDEDDDDGFEETPDWMAFGDDDLEEGEESDEFDVLRQKSARAGSAFDDIAEEDPFQETESSSFSLQDLSPSQRMILAVLVLLNVVVIGIGVVLLVL